ncbi:winged helix-turn-helix domain-containing protein [Methanoculleus chikugoensis]|uniref:ATP-dependent DNA helicase RecG C-terminal domain-containing protein n=1 Tax=Methanoculleus chikugoensis TaxID=118126 RepID=A0ABN5XH87_9EURY|nr:winged helix-turn-helix domain-containing protein [Methanoculleus chikugoensis]BBL68148.1 hypothetical protein MchiMG62_13290 [Methanoculleus chikugoensis]
MTACTTRQQAPVRYEIPREVVAEAIVNAVAHRDYASNGSVQVMLFADRPHGPVPANPFLAEPTISTRELAERIGITPKGIEWQVRRLRQAGRSEERRPLGNYRRQR